MRRRIVIALLTLGTVVGYGSGIARVLHAHGHCRAGSTPAPSAECARSRGE